MRSAISRYLIRSSPAVGLALCALVGLLATLLCATTPARAATGFYIRGGGDGHGIGMSQYGAYGYALHGKRYRFILSHYYRATKLGRVNPRRIVRVLVGSGTTEFSGASHAGAKRLKPAQTYTARPNADGTLTLLTQKGKTIGHFASPLTVSGPGLLAVNGGLYRGALELRVAGGSVETVEAVDLEDYVRGVISADIPASWSVEALKAQAVAARTYAITSSVGGRDYDVYPDTRSQMYKGVAAETPSTDAAVGATRGQVVTYHGRPAVTYFFNSSGGHTENIENVWPGAKPQPWLKGVPDPYDGAGGDPYHRWGLDLTVADAAGRLGGMVKGALQGIQVLGHGSSPRILTARVVGTRGSTRISGIQLQRAFGLLTTYASFTTISTLAGRAPTRAHMTRASGPAETRAVAALVPLVQRLVSQSVPGIHGTVFPARRGTGVAIELQQRGRWRVVRHARISAAGAYDVQLPASGTYRVVVQGIAGPAVRVS